METLPKDKLANIVIVEDNFADVEYVKSILANHRVMFNLYVCRDGKEILDFLYHRGEFSKAERPDLVLMDLNLPKIDGSQVLKIIQNDKTLNSLQVAILSGSRFEEDIASSYKHGAKFYMHKPFEINLFLTNLKKIEGLTTQVKESIVRICRV